MSKVMNWLFPESKLEANFPWSLGSAGKHYVKALGYFAVGSFVIPLLVLLPIWALALYDPFLLSLVENGGLTKALVGTFLTGAAATGLVLWIWRRFRNLDFNFTAKARLIAYSLIGGMATSVLVMWGVDAIHPYYPRIIRWVVPILTDDAGQPRMTFVMTLSLVSFVCGFGLQMWYVAKSLRREGMSLASAMGMSLESRRGSWWGATLFKTVWPVAVAYLLFQPIGELVVYIMGESHQPTVEMAKQATGGNFLMFALMAAVGAPIFEEIIFRGFLFQMIRSSLKRQSEELQLRTLPETGSFLGLRRAWVHVDNTLRTWSHQAGVKLRGLIGGVRADLAAVIISSMLFSLMHMQFNPTTLVLLFLLGCVHAELYRRTGSLYCSMLLHATNNGLEVLKLAMGS